MFVLASSSPRRRELLRNAGIEFEVQPADVPEVHVPGESPLAFASRLALAKADAIAQQKPHDYVLGADTIVIIEGEILGKPADASDATVIDVYTVTSQPLDPETKEPLNSVPIVEHGRDQFQLQLVDGAWKVVDGETVQS